MDENVLQVLEAAHKLADVAEEMVISAPGMGSEDRAKLEAAVRNFRESTQP